MSGLPRSSVYSVMSLMCISLGLLSLVDVATLTVAGGAATVGVQLAVTVLGDVPHPRQRLVARLLDDLQLLHIYATGSEVRYLEAVLYGRFAIHIIAHHTGLAKVGLCQEHIVARKTRKDPDDGVLIVRLHILAQRPLELG